MTRDSPFCQVCGTWTCPDCGWQRHRANLAVFQDCPRCGGGSNEDSSFARTRHRKQTWQQHNPAAGPLCAGIFPDGRIEICGHTSCHTIEWGDVDRDMRAALSARNG